MDKINILLLEDDLIFSQVFKNLMLKKGHEVTNVRTSKDFINQLASSQTPQLILMDLHLNKENALSLIKPTRARYPEAKIFIITAYASIATTVSAIKSGADDYLPKPFSVEDVLNAFNGKSNNAIPERMSPKRQEWEYIQSVLKEQEGNISKTAKILNMHRRTLQRKLKKKPR